MALIEYFEALDRLKKGTPERVAVGTKITNDAVALEAGRQKGSIKKSREVFTFLIAAINEAAEEQAKPKKSDKDRLFKAKETAENYRVLYEHALGREVMLLHRIHQLEAEMASLVKGVVSPFKQGR